jgi:xylulokinase
MDRLPVGDEALLGLDLGTTEVKAGLFTLEGRTLGMVRRAYPLVTGPDGAAEQDPVAWWAAVAEAVRALQAGTVEVVGICGVAQGPTLVATDGDGMPVRPAITWQDRRAGRGTFGLLPKLAFLARHDPAAAAQATWFLSAWDALGLWLTGRAVTSLQQHEAPLDAAAVEAAGIDPARIPPPLPYGSPLGGLQPRVAERLGLPAGTPVVAGVNDGAASMLGAGLLEPGDAVDTGGASGGFALYASDPVPLSWAYSAPAPIPGRWAVGGAMAATGASLDWLRAEVLGNRWSTDELIEQAAGVPAGAGGLLFLPYLSGERAPIFDERARGTFVGLTLRHDHTHLARAVLEGSAHALRHVADPIVAAGAPVRELRIAGRPSPDDVWARIKADVTGFTVAIPAVGETAVMGAAILAAAGAAGAGVDVVGGREAAVRRMTSVARRIEPDPASRGMHDRLHEVYRSLYPALMPAMHSLSDAAGEG